MNTILVTGSEGNIGKYLIKDIRKKYPNSKIIRISYSKKTVDKEKQDIIYQGDLRDPLFVCNIFDKNKIDYVIHAAGYFYDPLLAKKNPYDIINNDLLSLINVLNCCQNIKKFVYLSSSTIYESVDKFPFVEKSVSEILMPKSPYGIAKFFGEGLVEKFNYQYGIDYTIWRMFNIVSPLENCNGTGGHVFCDFYHKILVEKKDSLEIFGSGKQIRCFSWVEDVTDAIIMFLEEPKSNGQIFNIGSSKQTNLLELKDLLIRIGKNKGLLSDDYNPEIITGKKFFSVDSEVRIPSTKKINQLLGWSHKTDFEACFIKFVDYKKKNDK